MAAKLVLLLLCIFVPAQSVVAMEGPFDQKCISDKKRVAVAGGTLLAVTIVGLTIYFLSSSGTTVERRGSPAPGEPCLSTTSLYYPDSRDTRGIAQMIKNNYRANKCGPEYCNCPEGVRDFCRKPFHTVVPFTSMLGCRSSIPSGNIIVAYGKKSDCPDYHEAFNETINDLNNRNVSFCEIPAQQFAINVKKDEFFKALLIPILTGSKFVPTKQLASPSCVNRSSDWPWFGLPQGCTVDVVPPYDQDVSSMAWVKKTCERMPVVCARYSRQHTIPPLKKQKGSEPLLQKHKKSHR